MTRVRACARCGVNPIAYLGRRYCYDCVPRAWKKPLLCKRCGSDTDYFTGGLCRRCHRQAPLITSCRDCLAWGITRTHGGLCQACRGWNRRFPTPQQCPSCQRIVPLNARGYCRLCCRQAHYSSSPHCAIDVVEANRHGQQLFIADLFRHKRPPPPKTPHSAGWPSHYPVAHRQLTLFDLDRDYTAVRPSELPVPRPDLSAALDHVLLDHAHRHGWGKALESNTRNAIRLLLATQDTPGAPITASAATAVTTSRSLDNLKSVLEILAAAEMLNDDRQPTLDAYADRQVAELPDAMANEFREWVRVMREGSTTPPRSWPRDPATIRACIASATPALRSWATRKGYSSLREVSRDDVIDILPTEPYRRRQTLTALRVLFRLKGRRLVFTNPTLYLRGPQVSNQPLPIDLAALREALLSAKPVRAALAALVAFHALRPKDLCALMLTDLRDGRLHLDGRTILLADTVRAKLVDWLDERARRWPNTINPHLFINLHTAVRTCQVDPTWITATIGVSAQAIREDRILHEAITTGDVRRLCDLFGLTVGGAERYTHTLDQPGTTGPHLGSRT